MPDLNKGAYMSKKQIIIFSLIAGAILIACIAGIIITQNTKRDSHVALIYSDNVLIREIELKPDDHYSFEVTSPSGGKNVIIVHEGKIGVQSADCPDKICVNTPHVSDEISPIVCMPNKLVIKIK